MRFVALRLVEDADDVVRIRDGLGSLGMERSGWVGAGGRLDGDAEGEKERGMWKGVG